MDFPLVKIVLLGDDGVGKTSFLMTYTTSMFPRGMMPFVYDNFTSNVRMPDGLLVTCVLWDTAGSDIYDNIRPLVHPNTDVFVLCYNPTQPETFDHVREKWYVEANRTEPNGQFIVLALKTDLLQDVTTLQTLGRKHQVPISAQQGIDFALEIGAYKYLECSSLQDELTGDLAKIMNHIARAKFPKEDKKDKRLKCNIQ
jgi:small GTP-binding protein